MPQAYESLLILKRAAESSAARLRPTERVMALRVKKYGILHRLFRSGRG